MASHVVVLDSSARRAVIRTSPSKHLSDVLQEACEKLGLTASRYGLKNNNKHLDLSRTIRLSGLSSGAKLELVLLSRSPSVVSVALHLPEAEAEGIPGGRLIDKFPSTTTLWLMLRKFESTTSKSSAASRNFTARSVPRASDGTTSRLYYETPVLHVMGKELSSFSGLQKSLSQIGINSGSILIRLSFRVTDSPLEQAMEKIDQYFQSTNVEEQQDSGIDSSSNVEGELLSQSIEPDTGLGEVIDHGSLSTSVPLQHEPEDSPPPLSANNGEDIQAEKLQVEVQLPDETITGPNQRPISVYAAPSSTTPKAAQHAWNEQDYQPTIEDAIRHQSYLAKSTQNKRLLTDAEVAAKRKEQQEKLASITSITIKVRFPDGSSVTAPFSDVDTARSLYDFVRGLLVCSEPFMLNQSAAGGPRAVPKDGMERLVKDLGMNGRELVNFLWGEEASAEARAGPILKQEYRDKAQEIVVNEVRATETTEHQPTTIKPDKKENGKERGKGGTPKWLKPFGKK